MLLNFCFFIIAHQTRPERQDDHVWLGSIGFEWYGKSGEILHRNAEWVGDSGLHCEISLR